MTSPVQQAAALGVLQGLTEFLPFSSSGHRALVQALFPCEGASPVLWPMLQAGSLLASVVYGRKHWKRVLSEPLSRRVVGRHSKPPTGDLALLLVASLPTLGLAWALRTAVTAWATQPLAVGLGFLLTGLMLTAGSWINRGGATVNPSTALLLGIAQGIADFPGLSRIGATLTAARYLGIPPRRAFELSVLLGVPSLAYPCLGGLWEGGLPALAAPAPWIGSLVGFVVGLLALSLLEHAVERKRLHWFSLWLFCLAPPTIALARAWPEAPLSNRPVSCYRVLA